MEDWRDFSKGSIVRAVIRMSLPMICAQMVNVLYNVVDRIFISKLMADGTMALTGVGVTFPFIMIITAFANLCGQGGAPLCAMARGEGDRDKAEKILFHSFLLLAFCGVVLPTLGFAFKGRLLYLFGASGETFSYADSYLSVYLIGTPCVMMGLGLNPFINTQGFSKIGMLTVVIGAVVNVALDPLFIYVFGMGVQGAALATVLAQTVSAVWALCFLGGKRATVTLRLRRRRLEWPYFGRILGLGLTGFTMTVTSSVTQIACNATLQQFGGDLYVAVMTVINSLRDVVSFPCMGFAAGASPVVSYNYGAKRYDRTMKGIWVMGVGMAILSVSLYLVIMIGAGPLIRLFSNDPAVLRAGLPAVRTFFSCFWAITFQGMSQNGFVAMGMAKRSVFFSMLRKVVIVLPLTLLLPRLTGLGVNGVFIAEPVSDVVGGGICFTAFLLTAWRELKRKDRESKQSVNQAKECMA